MSITTRPPATAWIGVTCTDDRLRGLHRRHYSSEKSGRRRGRPVEHPNQLRMIGPGEYLALLTLDASAGFIWRRSRYRKDGQLGVECALFRNERGRRCEDRSHGHNSVRLIEEAVALAWAKWPGERLFTHVNPERVNATTPGYCFILAGFRALDERTRAGLVVLERLPGGAGDRHDGLHDFTMNSPAHRDWNAAGELVEAPGPRGG